MSDEISVSNGIIATCFTFIMGLVGRQTLQNTRDIKNIPKEYVTKKDNNRTEDRLSNEIQASELRLTKLLTNQHVDRKEEVKRLHERVDKVEENK